MEGGRERTGQKTNKKLVKYAYRMGKLVTTKAESMDNIYGTKVGSRRVFSGPSDMETGSGKGTTRKLVTKGKRCKVEATTHLKAKQNDTGIEREGDPLVDETDAKLIKETDLNKEYYMMFGSWNMWSLYEEEAL